MQKNQLIAIILCLLIFVGGMWLQEKIWPAKKPPAKDEPSLSLWEWAKQHGEVPKKTENPAIVHREGFWQWVAANAREEKPVIAKPAVEPKLFTMGGDTAFSKYILSSRSGSVISATLTKFRAANRIGKPEWIEKNVPKLLELIQEKENEANPSFQLFHFEVNNKTDDRPLDTLGKRIWDVIEAQRDEEGQSYSRVVFRTEVDGVQITKTYTYDPASYHLGLEVTLERANDAPKDRKLSFRYQLTSGAGMPLEGDWYTSTYRNALIGRVDGKNNLWRDFQDLRFISVRTGGNAVTSDDQKIIRYAGVATQFFASVIAVDKREGDKEEDLNFIRSARPTLEKASLIGTVKSVNGNDNTFTLTGSDKVDYTFHVAAFAWGLPEFATVVPGKKIGVVFRTDSHDHDVAVAILDPEKTNPLFLDDITVRVDTVPVELEPGKPVTHRYLLYNGPVKVRLLSHLEGDAAVNDALVDHYLNDLHLNTLTDYHFQGQGFPSWFGENVSSRIYLTNLLIATTNVMHAVLTFLHRAVPNYGVCIILLTIMVRGIMFPLSRKQALMSVRMQELQPEIKKLQEKYKEDRQALGLAQMELFRKHKVSPLGTCWVAFLQMPIFLGLYYALQESIHFRLAHFLWIDNLAAPDMLFYWGESIPWISQPASHGSLLYLGPFFNLLPVVAVALMITQQSMMAPPTADETQAMQQKMMKYMMIFFGLMFYKVAAGLCIYFIASSLWGFTERKLLPKRKKDGVTPAVETKPGLLQRAINRIRPDGNGASTVAPRVESTADAGTRAKRRAARNKRKEQANGSSGEGAWRKLKDWWADLLKQASKK